MALKPTIYKFTVAISDLDRNYYQSHVLTIARHPSESAERMVARLLAFCFNASDELSFTRGLSTPEEPDIWAKSLDQRIVLWIEVGEPTADRVKKACRKSEQVKIYTFNSKSDTWWQRVHADFSGLSAEVWQLPWGPIAEFAGSIERTTDMSITVSDATAYIAVGELALELPLTRFHGH